MSDVPRREFLKGAAVFGATCAVGGTLVKVGMDQYVPPPEPQAIIVRDSEGKSLDVTRDQLVALAAVHTTVLDAEWAMLPAKVYLVDPKILAASTKLRGVDTAQHAIALPGTDKLLLAYNGKCTHLGCTVGWDESLGASRDVEDYNADGVKDGRILCPCHNAQFDIYDLGTQVPGTPAPRPLPVIKIAWNGDQLMGTKGIPQEHPHDADGQ